ncbi:hypothetical protein RCL1_006784 [Eukaryota sp. TZLM3-RCL]
MSKNTLCLHRTCKARITDYSFLSHLSEGAQGFTTLRRHKDGKIYCFKQIPGPQEGEQLPEVGILFNELRSPFLVDLLHCFECDGQLHLCMEYCQGGSLHQLLESSVNLSKNDIWFILCQLAHGLHHLHTKQIIHRDVKPANVVLMSQERPFRVKFCDFGVSKQVNNTVAKTLIVLARVVFMYNLS